MKKLINNFKISDLLKHKLFIYLNKILYLFKLRNKKISTFHAYIRREISNFYLVHYLARSYNLFIREQNLQNKFKSAESHDYLKYVDTDSVMHVGEIMDSGVSLPHWKDMVTVQGSTDYRTFLQVGRSCFETIYELLPKKDNLIILDFGIGCGRTSRHFYRHLKNNIEVYGCDVDYSCINYLQNEVPFINPMVSNNQPPLGYPADYFDFIFSISVFSHLNEKMFIEWLNELTRITKNNGTLALSYHGEIAFDKSVKDKFKSLEINEKFHSKIKKDFIKNLYSWAPQGTSSKDIDKNQYGVSFINENFFKKNIPQNLSIESIIPGAINGWQDIIVLKKIGK